MKHCLKLTRFAEPFTETYPRLVAELEECFAEGDRLTTLIREQLGSVSDV